MNTHNLKNFFGGVYRCTKCQQCFDLLTTTGHILDDDLEYNANKDAWEAIVESAMEENQ